jgi:hypothetical protein
MAPTLTSEAWAQIRFDYERTERPVEAICAELGISSGTLRDRVRRWGWTRRREPIPREGPPPLPAPKIETWPLAGGAPRVPAARAVEARAPSALGEDSPHPAASHTLGGDPPPPGEGKTEVAAGEDALPSEIDDSSIVPRLQSAVARVLPAIEATVARLAAGAAHPREMEQAGRALGALTRALRELNSLLSERQPPAAGDAAAGEPPDDNGPEDIVAFRLELARRMDEIVAARTANADGDA